MPSIDGDLALAILLSAAGELLAASAFLEPSVQILPVGALAELSDDRLELPLVDEAQIESDLLRAADLDALSEFERADEVRRVDQRIRCPRVEPSVAAPEALDIQPTGFEIGAVHVGDLVFAARRRLEGLRNLD